MNAKHVKHLLSPDELQIEPVEKSFTIPSNWYFNTDLFEFEINHLLKPNWQYLCHRDQIKTPGSYYCSEVAQNPLIAFTDSNGQVRTFYNVCKHRGGPLAIKQGTRTVLQCQYHGWTYLDDGSLRGVPDWNKVDLFDKKDFGLEPVEHQIWDGLIFVKLKPSSIQLADLLQGISKQIYPLSVKDLQFHTEVSYDINCNWKVYVDNYLEGYHIPIVHPELSDLLDYREYSTHTAEWYSLQHSPFKNGENIYSSEGGQAFYYFVFPNIMLNILPDRLQMNSVLPLAPDKTRVVFSYFYADTETKEAAGTIREDMGYSDRIQREDVEICEAVQRGLKSDAYHKGRFSVKREFGVYHFQSLLKREFQKVLKSWNGTVEP